VIIVIIIIIIIIVITIILLSLQVSFPRRLLCAVPPSGCCPQVHVDEPAGDILVFLTGQEEIDSLVRLLDERATALPEGGFGGQGLLVLPIYAALPPEQQIKVRVNADCCCQCTAVGVACRWSAAAPRELCCCLQQHHSPSTTHQECCLFVLLGLRPPLCSRCLSQPLQEHARLSWPPTLQKPPSPFLE
jgi:hypothetical protein